MRLTKSDLDEAVGKGILENSVAEELWNFLTQSESGKPQARFNLSNLLWYTGSLIVIVAMGIFSSESFGRWGGDALFLTAITYAAAFTFAGKYFWNTRQIRILGGLLVTVAVSMAPLATFGVQHYLGWWTHGDPGPYGDFFVWIRGSWVFMSVSAIIAGIFALKYFKFPFITFIIAFALWFLSMDITPWIIAEWPEPGAATSYSHENWRELAKYRGMISVIFGLVLLIFAWIIDLRTQVSFTFWLHFTVALCIYGGIYMWISPENIQENTIICGISIFLLFLAIFLERRVYAVFGGLGLTHYLAYLSWKVFDDTLLFSFALSGIGILVMILGYWYFKNAQRIHLWIDRNLSPEIRRLRPSQEK
jgi:hypothetical protein